MHIPCSPLVSLEYIASSRQDQKCQARCEQIYSGPRKYLLISLNYDEVCLLFRVLLSLCVSLFLRLPPIRLTYVSHYLGSLLARKPAFCRQGQTGLAICLVSRFEMADKLLADANLPWLSLTPQGSSAFAKTGGKI